MTLEVIKIMCRQFVIYKISNPEYIAMWISGYYHGKRGDPIVDTQALSANAKKLQDYCLGNPDVTAHQNGGNAAGAG